MNPRKTVILLSEGHRVDDPREFPAIARVDYMQNKGWAWPATDPLTKESVRLSEPTPGMITFGDGHSFRIEMGDGEPWIRGGGYSSAGNHGRGDNMLFRDGHVEYGTTNYWTAEAQRILWDARGDVHYW